MSNDLEAKEHAALEAKEQLVKANESLSNLEKAWLAQPARFTAIFYGGNQGDLLVACSACTELIHRLAAARAAQGLGMARVLRSVLDLGADADTFAKERESIGEARIVARTLLSSLEDLYDKQTRYFRELLVSIQDKLEEWDAVNRDLEMHKMLADLAATPSPVGER